MVTKRLKKRSEVEKKEEKEPEEEKSEFEKFVRELDKEGEAKREGKMSGPFYYTEMEYEYKAKTLDKARRKSKKRR